MGFLMENIYLIGGVTGFVVFVIGLIVAMSLRRVVPTNEVHIVQSSKRTLSYGKDMAHGNTYYEFPPYIPVFGVNKIMLPVSVFELNLNNYEAYDKGRVPFVLDISAFFQIDDSNVAAQRVESFEELGSQLKSIVQGSVRTILSSFDIETIMHDRSVFGDKFTAEVSTQLKSWGVKTVKNLELMDIRDSNNSTVIKNIMEKKKSLIDMQSRVEVAQNQKIAQIAEINAQKETAMEKQMAEKEVGLKTVENEREVEINNQQAQQLIKEQQKITKEKEMEVIKVEQVKKAEIDKSVQIVDANRQKETSVIKAEGEKQTLVIKASAEKETQIVIAEGEKQKTVIIAEGVLEQEKKNAEAVKVNGEASASAKNLMELALISGQIGLAKEIGDNKGYQEYLITIRKIEAEQEVGIKQAEALTKADVKVIANSGNVNGGVKNVMDLFSASGGTEIGAMIEGVAQTPMGKKIIDKFAKTEEKPKS